MKTKLKRYVLTDEIYKVIKESILSHKLAPGEKVNIDQLARDLEVSNIPIREALSKLASEELVRVIPFKGMYVTRMSLQDLNEIFEIRIHLETLAIEKAALLIPEEELLKLNEEMHSFSMNKPSNHSEYLQYVIQMNEALHGLILKYCCNDALRKLAHGYISRIQSYLVFVQKNMEVSTSHLEWEEHVQILKQLLNRNVDGAVQAMRHHLEESCNRTNSFFQ